MKYQLKPKQIDAYQFTGDIKDFKENIHKDHYTIGCDFKTISINTKKGRQILNVGDYLIAGIGPYYDIMTKAAFEDVYEPVIEMKETVQTYILEEKEEPAPPVKQPKPKKDK